MKNIDELNAISEKVGIPKIRIEVKNISATRELGVDQAIVPKAPQSPGPEKVKPVRSSLSSY